MEDVTRRRIYELLRSANDLIPNVMTQIARMSAEQRNKVGEALYEFITASETTLAEIQKSAGV